MTFSTIPEMFLNTTNNFADKYLYYYKKADQWIGLKGKDIKNVVLEISAALKSLKIEIELIDGFELLEASVGKRVP